MAPSRRIPDGSPTHRMNPAGMRCTCRRFPSRRTRTVGRYRPRADRSRWSPNGRELLYLRPDGTLMSVPIETAPFFAIKGIPVPLFKTALSGVDPWRLDYVPSADEKQFLTTTQINEVARPAITVVLNWPALLKR